MDDGTSRDDQAVMPRRRIREQGRPAVFAPVVQMTGRSGDDLVGGGPQDTEAAVFARGPGPVRRGLGVGRGVAAGRDR
jgi:hypothetical protein